MITIPKGSSPISAEEAKKSLREEFLSPQEIRMHQAIDSILETLKDAERRLHEKKNSD